MNIELKKPNKFQHIFSKLCSSTEDILFSILLKIPTKLIPTFVGPLINNYIEKRICQLQLKTTKATWKSIQLESALAEIKEKAPVDD